MRGSRPYFRPKMNRVEAAGGGIQQSALDVLAAHAWHAACSGYASRDISAGTPPTHPPTTSPKWPQCPLHHCMTVHPRLIHCMRWTVAFRTMCLATWGPWHGMVTKWWVRASAVDLHHVLCLRIPQSHLPESQTLHFKERVVWHHYHALHGV